ncbi:nuclear transport factor 2 family protein [Rhodococcus sp. NPDC058514]|uniref:nuclear transport factor 2 family protein n=1 Tax=unclassified Rhodococcus (in: high G+C Gram-positive bacteria) TaxID=192944 RepID=UPI0036606525
MSAEQNIEIAKQGYAAFSAGDAEAAMANLADDLEWIVPGNSAVSGSFHGKAEVGGLWMKMAEKSLTTTPEHFLGDGERVVVLTRVSAGGESWDAADVLTYRDGKVVKIQSVADTAKAEKVFGTA